MGIVTGVRTRSDVGRIAQAVGSAMEGDARSGLAGLLARLGCRTTEGYGSVGEDGRTVLMSMAEDGTSTLYMGRAADEAARLATMAVGLAHVAFHGHRPEAKVVWSWAGPEHGTRQRRDAVEAAWFARDFLSGHARLPSDDDADLAGRDWTRGEVAGPWPRAARST